MDAGFGERGAQLYGSCFLLLKTCLWISAAFLNESALQKSLECVWCPKHSWLFI